MLVVLLLLLQASHPPPAKPPEQPVPYSHKKHLALGLKCQSCHVNADPGEMMGFPSVSMCMGCHKTVKTESRHIGLLAKHAEEKSEPVWKRVYLIPSYVFFSHRAHTEAGAQCETCHGPVRERDVLARETDISMGGCMSCHQKNKASNACNYCHEPR